ncbi:Pesticin receptor [Zhongshania aliphaticivorans]|uniref:Pesticin receptor n=2 Tax=Zhongshania aliphaticivorans TaxID=1470434 RepID=A0A5S9PQJ9_9GAMM|nr:Pesticin receptor [Zhongshania aliphaticivorans]CAA0106595.1 Pesticin receptor [Zhongshania aliphaticivorans]
MPSKYIPALTILSKNTRQIGAFTLFTVGSSMLSSPLTAAPRIIEEVIVTANKKAESTQDVPLSISVVGADFIQESGLSDVGEITRYIPNVSFDSSLALYTSITIRGFGTPPLGVGFEPSIGLVIDDVPYGRSTFAQDAVFDIDRLEVLRGPQGTLFGKNTLGGVLNFHTMEPTPEPEGFIKFGHGEDIESNSIEGAISGPIFSEKFLGRLAFRYNDADTLEYNSTRDEQQTQEDKAVRLKLSWFLSDTLTAKFTGLYAESLTKGYTQSLFIASDRSMRVFQEYDPDTESDAFDQNTSTDAPTRSDREVKAASLSLIWQPDELMGIIAPELTTIASWSEVITPYSLDVDYSPVPLVAFNEPPKGNPYSAKAIEMRLAGGLNAPFDWGEGMDFVVGVFAQESTNDVFQDIDVSLNGLVAFARAGAIVQNIQLPFDPLLIDLPISLPDLIPGFIERERYISATQSETQSFAIFSQFNWILTDRLTATAGIRYGQDESEGSSYSQVAEGLSISGGSLNQSDFDAPNLSSKESNVSPKLAFNYEVLPDINIYVNAAKGFKAGGFDPAPLNDDNLTYKGEETLTYEAGMKSRLLGGSLTLNMAVFDSEVKNLQIRTFSGVTLTTFNAPESSSRGAEMDFFWLPPIDGVSLAGSLAYLDAKYDSFTEGPPLFTSEQNQTQDLSGRPLPYAPRWSGSLSPRWEFPVFGSANILGSIRMNISYTDERYLDSDIDPNTLQDAVTRTDVGLGLRSEVSGWSVNFQARNVTQEQDAVLILDQPLIPGNYTKTPHPDQTTYQLDFRVGF